MRSRFLPIVVTVLVSSLPAAAIASGPWTTWLRPFTYTDLVADRDTVWCATLEGGLLRFLRASGQFEPEVREPGGLASNSLTALTLDRSRRLWVGTRGSGVSLLAADLTSWSLLNAFDGLPNDTINVLEADGDTVWIGTRRGIALWNGREISGVLPDGTNPSPFASDDIRGVAVLRDSVWIATRAGAYLSLRSSGLASWTAVSTGLPTGRIDALASDGRSVLVLDSLRVYRLDPTAASWSATPDIGSVRGLSDDLGTVAVTSERGIRTWNGASWSVVITSLVSNSARWDSETPGRASRANFAVAVDDDGRFIAANQDGVYEQPAAPGAWPPPTFPPSPPGNNILNLATQDARVYVTTLDEGIGRYDGAVWKHWLTSRVGNPSDTTFFKGSFPFALLVDRAGLKWVGCWSAAVDILDDSGPTPRFTHVWSCTSTVDCDCPHTFTWSSAADSSGGRWFGMDNPCLGEVPALGLDYYDATGDHVANYSPENSQARGDRIHALTVDREGLIWVGYAGQGIDTFLPPSPGGIPAFSRLGRTDLDVKGLVAHGDVVWVRTTGDLRRYNLRRGLIDSLEVPAGTSALGLKPLAVTDDGTAWLGTGGGLYAYRPDGSIAASFTTANSPLASNDVRAVAVEPGTGRIWIGSAGGLNQYDPGYVPPPAPRLPRLELSVFPNPARVTAVGISLKLSGNSAGYRGRIHDLTGRLVARFAGADNGRVVWDGRDLDGRVVKPGIYFIRVEAGGRSGTARVVLVR